MEIKVCPSCGSPEIEVDGNKVHCKACDVTFRITPDGAKVDNLDPLSKDRERLDKIEQDVKEIKNRGPHGQAPEANEETEGPEDDGFGIEILPDDDKPKSD